MADREWSKKAFVEGYSSGDIIGLLKAGDPETDRRLFEEKRIGGNLSDFFLQGVAPHLSSETPAW